MKHFRRILAIMISAVCVLSFVACGGNTSVTGKEFTYGETKDGIYKNSFVGIQVSAPENWDFLNDEQIAQVMGQVTDAFPDVDAFKNSSSAEKVVMYLIDSASGGANSINLTFGKGGIFVSLEKTVEENKKVLKSSYEQMGATVEFAADDKVTLGGVEFTRVNLTVAIGEMTISQYCYFVMNGRYVCVIAATDVTGVGRDCFENMISAYTE